MQQEPLDEAWWTDKESRRFPLVAEFEKIREAAIGHLEKKGMRWRWRSKIGDGRRALYILPGGFEETCCRIAFMGAPHQATTKFDTSFPVGVYLQCDPRLTAYLRCVNKRYEDLEDTRMVTRTGKLDTDMGRHCTGKSIREKIAVCLRWIDDCAKAAELAPQSVLPRIKHTRSREATLNWFLHTHAAALNTGFLARGREVTFPGSRRRLDLRFEDHRSGALHLVELKTESNPVADDSQLLHYLCAQREQDRVEGKRRKIIGHLLFFYINPERPMHPEARTNVETMISKCHAEGFETHAERWALKVSASFRGLPPAGTISGLLGQGTGDPVPPRQRLRDFLRDYYLQLGPGHRFLGAVEGCPGDAECVLRFNTPTGDTELYELTDSGTLESQGVRFLHSLAGTGKAYPRKAASAKTVCHLLAPPEQLTPEARAAVAKATDDAGKHGVQIRLSNWTLRREENW